MQFMVDTSVLSLFYNKILYWENTQWILIKVEVKIV